MKTCSVCKLEKDKVSFGARKASKDGLTAACKACLVERDRERYDKERDYRLERQKIYSKTPDGKAAHKEARERWSARNSNRRAAQIILGNAVRDGRIIPWHFCAIPECNCKPEAHHPDYDRPLDVVWLCDKHHKEAHKLGREIERNRK